MVEKSDTAGQGAEEVSSGEDSVYSLGLGSDIDDAVDPNVVLKSKRAEARKVRKAAEQYEAVMQSQLDDATIQKIKDAMEVKKKAQRKESKKKIEKILVQNVVLKKAIKMLDNGQKLDNLAATPGKPSAQDGFEMQKAGKEPRESQKIPGAEELDYRQVALFLEMKVKSLGIRLDASEKQVATLKSGSGTVPESEVAELRAQVATLEKDLAAAKASATPGEESKGWDSSHVGSNVVSKEDFQQVMDHVDSLKADLDAKQSAIDEQAQRIEALTKELADKDAKLAETLEAQAAASATADKQCAESVEVRVAEVQAAAKAEILEMRAQLEAKDKEMQEALLFKQKARDYKSKLQEAVALLEEREAAKQAQSKELAAGSASGSTDGIPKADPQFFVPKQAFAKLDRQLKEQTAKNAELKAALERAVAESAQSAAQARPQTGLISKDQEFAMTIAPNEIHVSNQLNVVITNLKQEVGSLIIQEFGKQRNLVDKLFKLKKMLEKKYEGKWTVISGDKHHLMAYFGLVGLQNFIRYEFKTFELIIMQYQTN